MDTRAEIRDFLATRRAKISPQQVGLPVTGRRRVPGLRREEVAVLAGMSTDWYVRLERGHIADVSDDVLAAVARALQLDEAEQAHLHDLARAARPTRRPHRRPRPRIRPSVQWMLDSMTAAPAFVRNGRMDILASNTLGRALYAPMFDHGDQPGPVNIARFNFLNPRARDFYPHWDTAADTTVAIMRTEAGRDPHDRDLTDLVGELATRSDEFRSRWAGHDVRLHYTGPKSFHHPVVGHLDLVFEAIDLPTDDLRGLNLTVYTAPPGSATEDALKLLASWAASHDTTIAPDAGEAITAEHPIIGEQ
ncbi:helix-turn-helix domain-containing protein [Frankia sp. CN6]|uniref:Helix-turn-helix domain-containing protein n=1 Tax=Frankia nepalensis TaxID=1836974 RepID=A0A937RH15_9ACTN|nr:helix-turn-helix transcriptional regulator [Frankia nepalensis]MBL7632061.1 helix-turn-helix domain-containing protein [Frankia nepalensis]